MHRPRSFDAGQPASRYVMTRVHGESRESLDPALRREGWADLGPVDPVKAILMANRLRVRAHGCRTN